MCPDVPDFYLEICLDPFFEATMPFMNEIMPEIIRLIAVLAFTGLLFRGLIMLWNVLKTLKLIEALDHVTTGIMFTGAFGFLTLISMGLIFATYSVQAGNGELFFLALGGMALFTTTWVGLFLILITITNSILLLFAVPAAIREQQEKKKHHLSDGSDCTEGLAL